MGRGKEQSKVQNMKYEYQEIYMKMFITVN